MEIVNLFYELSRQHRRVKGFAYDGARNHKGAGNEIYPLVWLDDPILLRGNNTGSVLQYTCNVDILGIPLNKADVVNVQNEALRVGLSFIEKIRDARPIWKLAIESFTAISLREYSDNNDAGQRFTFIISGANPIDLCADEYDPDKTITPIPDMPDFKTDAPEGCTIFNDKAGLPNFTLS